MAAPIPFESTWKKKELKEHIQQERERYIEKLKRKHEKEEWKKEQAHLRGEDTWMLDSVTERLNEEEKSLEKVLKKKKKKEKKHKKEKKQKKKKKKNKHNESSSESDSKDEVGVWSEKSASATEKPVIKGPSLQRDSWMLDPLSDFGALPSITKTEFNEQRQKEKVGDKGTNEKAKQMFEVPGQHEKELNPYWKEGGTGLPEEEPRKKKKAETFSADVAAGDGGASWWQRAYQRCVELADEQGKTLEEVAADRYGSLKNLESMLAKAIKNEKKLRMEDRHSEYQRRHDHRQRYDEQRRERSRSPLYHKRLPFRRPDLHEDSSSAKTNENERSSSEVTSCQSWKKKGFLKPGENYPITRQHKEHKEFMKPGDHKDDYYSKSRTKHAEERSVPRWKKENRNEDHRSVDRDNAKARHREHERSLERQDNRYRHHNREDDHDRDRNKDSETDKRRDSKREEECRQKEKNNTHETEINEEPQPSSSSDSSSSEDSSSTNDSESEAESQSLKSAPRAPKILSEQELNELGAKMIKAELMGDEELAAQLKAQIEESRKAKEMHMKSNLSSEKKEPMKEKKSEEVVLTLTDRFGNVRPLSAREHTDSGARRRKQKVKTHSQGGSRERYFHDDDNKDLKSLVEQEKLGTAEDSNYQFIKLAGKAFGGRQGLEDMDEVFMEGASKKTSEAKLELKERSQAIAEHRKMSAAMEKCHFCFEKVPKHLIIAIGLKVYLCLPNHRSITEGHCLIVPMQHLTQSTCIDEDVFEEMQVFRRALTRMYEMHDLDCVFMETCKDLHRHPHMVIECVPLPRELGDMAPIYFKKAIQESESEWSQNKKVVDLSKKDIRHAVPKGFPYFAVNFGLQGGFAHVIEEEKGFPYYFGREILGGMLDLEPALWRKPHKESFDEQRKKVLAFAEWWKPVDWTQKLKTASDSD